MVFGLSILERLVVAGERHLGSMATPLLHRRHHRTLERGAVDAETVAQARATWWGDDSRWYPGGTPPRRNTHITPLVEGEPFFAALHSALKEAEHYVYITGWCLTPQLPLLRARMEDLVQTRLLTVLSETAQRLPVRLLLWAGAPLIIQPTRRTMEGVASTMNAGQGDLVCRLDRTATRTHCHHQKAIVIDGKLAFVGGMDLTTFAGDRWDGPSHPLRAGVNWHDVTLLVEGEVVRDVEDNFRQRWEAVTGDATLPHCEPQTDPSWQTQAQVVRTIPRNRYRFAPNGEFGIHHAYLEAIRLARKFIYLETQYLWSPDLMDALIEAIERPPSQSFRILIVLPARATSGKWDNDQHVARLRKVDRHRGIVEIYSLYTSGPNSGETAFAYRPVYVHAKVAIIDDEWLTVGSANLNNRGFVTDSELNVVVRDPSLARRLRTELWSEHLGLEADELGRTTANAVIDSVWKAQAKANAGIIRRGEQPLESSVHLYESGVNPGALILDELEAATFEH